VWADTCVRPKLTLIYWDGFCNTQGSARQRLKVKVKTESQKRRTAMSDPDTRTLSQLKDDVDEGGVVGRLAVPFGGLETNLLGGVRCSLVQPVAQSLDHAHDA